MIDPPLYTYREAAQRIGRNPMQVSGAAAGLKIPRRRKPGVANGAALTEAEIEMIRAVLDRADMETPALVPA